MSTGRRSEPFTLRLSRGIDAFVSAEAVRTRRSKGAVLESLADEAMRMRRFPGIAFRGSDWNRRAWVIGTALDVWEIAQSLEDFGSTEALLAQSYVSALQLRTALAYRDAHRAEIENEIAHNRRSLGDLRSQFPVIEMAPQPG